MNRTRPWILALVAATLIASCGEAPPPEKTETTKSALQPIRPLPPMSNTFCTAYTGSVCTAWAPGGIPAPHTTTCNAINGLGIKVYTGPNKTGTCRYFSMFDHAADGTVIAYHYNDVLIPDLSTMGWANIGKYTIFGHTVSQTFKIGSIEMDSQIGMYLYTDPWQAPWNAGDGFYTSIAGTSQLFTRVNPNGPGYWNFVPDYSYTIQSLWFYFDANLPTF